MKSCIVYIDGGSRGNPGNAGYGVAIRAEDGNEIANLSQNIGVRTNNYAEYSALLAALGYALSEGFEKISIFADSELLVRQIQGIYKVKSPDLKPLYVKAISQISRIKKFSI